MIRPNSELLEVFLNNQKHFHTGLCLWLKKLYRLKLLNEDEVNYIGQLIKDNRPLGIPVNTYYWNIFRIKPRIQWLKNI